MKIHLTLSTILTLILLSCKSEPQNSELSQLTSPKNSLNDTEVFYHIFQRSFYDSNNDGHGDLNGIIEKVSYFKELGVTSILFTPLYKSIYYHNYFPDDFEEIDEEFGTLNDYLKMVKTFHRNDLKFYMDMEIHYVTKNHLWFKDSFENPESPYSKHVIYNGDGNTKPESMIFNLTKLDSYDGNSIDITTVDLYNEEVKQYFYDLFSYWVDPNEDGNFEDGVDGFRIDHMMDDIDWKGIRTDLFANFWAPLFEHLKTINPEIKILGETANWKDPGEDYFNVGNVDRLFAFGLREGILSNEKSTLSNKIDSLGIITPKNKNQIIFIENHDTPRYATLVENKDELLRLGGFLMFMNKGIPSIYYGQEIGMKGFGGFGRFDSTDGNDIPMREAFEWYSDIEGPGMALWYKDSGPWWDESSLKKYDGISYEEQKDDDGSLFNFYKSIIDLRKANSALNEGTQMIIENDNPNVITYLRKHQDQIFLIVANLSDHEQATKVYQDITDKTVTPIFSSEKDNGLKSEIKNGKSNYTIHLDKYGFGIWQIQ